VPILIDKIEVRLNFHIYDIMDFDLLLGFPLDELLDKSKGSLDVNLREAASSTSISCHKHSMTGHLPKQIKPARENDACISVRIIRSCSH
jgi:hypothetical protein